MVFWLLLSHNLLISNDTTEHCASEVIAVVRVISFWNRISYNELQSCRNFEIIHKVNTRSAPLLHLMWTDLRFLWRFWCDLQIEYNVQRFNFIHSVKGARIINSCEHIKTKSAKQSSFLISLTAFHISMQLRRSKKRCWNPSSWDTKCFCVLSAQRNFCISLLLNKTNSDTHSIRSSFILNLKICEAQLKELSGGNKWALRDEYGQSSNKKFDILRFILIISHFFLFLSLL